MANTVGAPVSTINLPDNLTVNYRKSAMCRKIIRVDTNLMIYFMTLSTRAVIKAFKCYLKKSDTNYLNEISQKQE